MMEYIDQIEKYLRGKMSLEEENSFKKSLKTDAYLRSYAFIMAFLLKAQKLR